MPQSAKNIPNRSRVYPQSEPIQPTKLGGSWRSSGTGSLTAPSLRSAMSGPDRLRLGPALGERHRRVVGADHLVAGVALLGLEARVADQGQQILAGQLVRCAVAVRVVRDLVLDH